MKGQISYGLLIVLAIISIAIVIIIVIDELDGEWVRTKKIVYSCATSSIRGIITGAVMSGAHGAMTNGILFTVMAPVMIFVEGLLSR